MKKVMIGLVMLMISSFGMAEVYVDAGFGYAITSYSYENNLSCGYDNLARFQCSTSSKEVEGIIFDVELGYTKGNMTYFFRHTSLPLEYDGRGFNLIGFKKRFKVFE